MCFSAWIAPNTRRFLQSWVVEAERQPHIGLQPGTAGQGDQRILHSRRLPVQELQRGRPFWQGEFLERVSFIIPLKCNFDRLAHSSGWEAGINSILKLCFVSWLCVYWILSDTRSNYFSTLVFIFIHKSDLCIFTNKNSLSSNHFFDTKRF